MAVLDDVRRLSQMDSIYLAEGLNNTTGASVTSWHKGRLQQANDGSWIFRSMSQEGTIIGFQLGAVAANWQSNETPSTGVTVTIPITQFVNVPGTQGGEVYLGWVGLA